MISKFWWINFILSLLIIGLIAAAVMVWQQQVVIPAPPNAQTVDQWPQPLSEEMPSPPRSDYETVVSNNLFHEKRREVTPESLMDAKPAKTVIAAAAPSDPAPKEPEILEGSDLNVFGVIIAGNLKYALINNVAQDSEKKQIRVKEKDQVGNYTIKKIYPDNIIVTHQNKNYKVPVFDKKTGDNPAQKKKVTGNGKPAPEQKPVVVAADKKIPTEKVLGVKPKKEDDGYEWVTFDTPFGKKG